VILRYNLQFFAAEGNGGEKTEPATEKKLDDARKDGQVAKSREIANGFGILALFLLIKFYIGYMGGKLIETFQFFYNGIPDYLFFEDGYMPKLSMQMVFRQMIIQMALIVLPIFAIVFVVAFLCDAAQIKWMVTGKPLQPKFSKLNPLSGFKRIFSANSLFELFKALLKIILILYITYSYLKDQWKLLFTLYDMNLLAVLKMLGNIVVDLGIRISVVYMIIAFGDFAYQKYKFSKDMRMTKQEIKDEYKQSEGDPQIKGRIRQKMREASQRRMMQDIPKADVVITNPTHFAVAIMYDPDENPAPVVLAKGADYIAAKIKEAAKENSVEIVENKPLARALYANVEIGESVPPELYQAVAEVLAYVYKLTGKI